MIISHKHKFIFICNGKVASSSIEAAFKQYDEKTFEEFGSPGLFNKKHIPPAILKSVLPAEIWGSYYKFVFVRHPVDWFVSLYKHHYQVAPLRWLKESWANPIGIPHRIKSVIPYSIKARKNYFNRADVCDLYERLKNVRGMPGSESLMQSNYVVDADGNKIVNFVGKFESLGDDLSQIASQIGIEIVLPHLNKSKTRKPDVKESFSDEALDEIYKLWAEDFSRFGYQKNNSRLMVPKS